MGFRTRLALFLVVTLAIVQVLTAVLVYAVTRRELIVEGQHQLAASASAFVRQLDDISQRVADNVEVLALDYALRAAIAQRDQSTVLSALRNHGRRVGASRMLLIGLDGALLADTAKPSPRQSNFPFPELLNRALEDRVAAVVALDGRAYWMIVVPVNAPQPIALIGAGIPIDDALLARMQELSALPREIELVAQSGEGVWSVLAHGGKQAALTANLLAQNRELPEKPVLVDVEGREYVALAVRLDRVHGGAPITAVLGYSIDEALRPYRSVATSWGSLLALGLAFGLIGALLIARGVSRPLEDLATTARRIEAGDYSSPPPLKHAGEIGQLSAALANMTNAISEREERIRFQVDHDALTGLPNRVAAEATIQRILDMGVETSGALLMIGLRRLPEIIQTMGHALSDRLMLEVGACVRTLAGERLAARASDTKFLIWLPRAGKAEAIAFAFRIVDALGKPYQEADLAIDLAPAVGTALYPLHGAQASALLQHADVALFAALASEEPVGLYDPATDPHRPERLSLMAELREALDANQLEFYYQPTLNLATGQIDGAEGLVRWHHPKRGFIPPDSFIALAEETGNIRALTRWALAAGVAQAQRWNADGRSFRVAVNLSARDLDDADLPSRVGELLAVHAVKPESIILEITESAVMGEPEAAIRVLKRLADMGIDLAIDDFGVGQSSFAYLRRLPVRELKIDKSFVQRLATDNEDRTIVSSIVELGHRLGYRVTSEGVETSAALDYLAQIGCDHAQGYFISKALPVAEFDRFLGEWRWIRSGR